MQLQNLKTRWILYQTYVLIADLKVKELLTVYLSIDIKLHLENIEKGWNMINNILYVDG